MGIHHYGTAHEKTTNAMSGVAWNCGVWLWQLDAYGIRQEKDNGFWNDSV